MLRISLASNAWAAILAMLALVHFSIFSYLKFFFFSSLMAVPCSSKRSIDRNVEINTCANIYVRKWYLLLLLNLTK